MCRQNTKRQKKSKKVKKKKQKKRKIAKMETGNCMSPGQRVRPRDWMLGLHSQKAISFPVVTGRGRASNW